MTSVRNGRRLIFEDHFDGPELDRSVWLPNYLPAWSSRAATAATYLIRDSCLRLFIPAGQGLWLAGERDPPLRVSGISDADDGRGLRLPRALDGRRRRRDARARRRLSALLCVTP